MTPARKVRRTRVQPVKPLFDPAKFYTSFFDETVVQKRLAELEAFKMDEIQSKRGWYGWELPDCSWSSSWKPSIAVSNYRCWPAEARGWILQVLDQSGNHTCILRKKALREMPEDEWKKLMKTIDKLKNDYPMLDDSDHSEVESEGQDEEWNDTYREEFQKLMSEKFDGVFSTMHNGDRIEQKFIDLINDDQLTDRFFYDYMRERWRGEEWTEDQSGDWSIDVSDIVDGIETQDIVDYVYPEDPRQLKFKFMHPQAEALVRKMLDDDLMVMVESPTAQRIVDILLEDKGPHKYSCVMINLPEELSQEIIAWGRLQVKDEDVFVDEKGGCGREEEPHVTVLYGLLDEKPSDMLLQVFEHTAPFDIKLGPCSLFRNGEYDVLKMEVISPFLHALNRNVCSVVAYENDYPDYKPHVTIAYVKPGTADRLEGATPWDDPVKMGVTRLGQEGHFTAGAVIFSSKNGQKTEHTLGTSEKTAKAVKEAFDERFSRGHNLFAAERGYVPTTGVLVSWIREKAAVYKEETGKTYYPDNEQSRADFNAWLENHVNVGAAMKDWEPAAFEAATGRKPETEGELQKWIREASQAYYRETGKIRGLREWLTSLQEVEMTDQEMQDFVQTSGTVDIPHKVNNATIRRLLGRVLVDRVEIKKNPGEFRNSREGFIRIVYRLGNQSRAWEDEWACFDVLKWSLRNWRNLYGVPLFVNGEPAGKVDYRNPALAE